jgi:hypothetical protein
MTNTLPADNSGRTPDPIHGCGPYAPGAWLTERLPLLAPLGLVLLPGGPDKRPTVGNEWQQHPGFTVQALQAAQPPCICWHIGAEGCPFIALDIDGPKVIAWLKSHGLDPLTAETWRIQRTGNAGRLKLVFRVTPEQKALLVAGGKEVRIAAGEEGEKDPGEEFALYGRPGTQIVVLGNHHTKESNYTEHDDQYAWAGKAPAEVQLLPEDWLAFLIGVFTGDRPLAPPKRRKLSAPNPKAPRHYRATSRSWRNSDDRHPCPICGRTHTGKCSIHTDGAAVWCSHGTTCSAPDCSTPGEVITGRDGRQWGYVRTEEQDPMGERSLFVLDKPLAKLPPAERPEGDDWIPETAPTGNGHGGPQGAMSSGTTPQTVAQGFGQAPAPDEEEAAEQAAEIESFQKVEDIARTVTPEVLYPPGLAGKLRAYAAEQQLAIKGFYLPIQTAVASIIGNRAVAVPQIGDELVGVSILWGMNIASMSGGKSPTSKPTIERPLVTWHIRERDKHSAEMKDWKREHAKAEAKAKLIASEKSTGGEPEDPIGVFLENNPQPERRHLVATDITFERLEVVLGGGSTPGLLIWHDEMAQWFSQLCRSPEKSDRAKWLALRTGAAILTERQGREEVAVANPACSLFGNIQPARVAGLWKADMKACEGQADGDGLWARFLFVNLPEWDYTYRQTTVHLAPVLRSLYEAIDKAAAELPPGQDGKAAQIPLSEKALALYERWTHDLLALRKARVHEDDRGFITKLRDKTLTLALTLHAIRCGSCGLPLATAIAAETLTAAIQQACLFIVERDRLMAPLRASSKATEAMQLLTHGRDWQAKNGDLPVPLDKIRDWRLPTRKMPAPERRAWLEKIVGSTPGMGEVILTERSVAWRPPA